MFKKRRAKRVQSLGTGYLTKGQSTDSNYNIPNGYKWEGSDFYGYGPNDFNLENTSVKNFGSGNYVTGLNRFDGRNFEYLPYNNRTYRSNTASVIIGLVITVIFLIGTLVAVFGPLRQKISNSGQLTFPTLPSSNLPYKLPKLLFKTADSKSYYIDESLAISLTKTMWHLQETALAQHDSQAMTQLVASNSPNYYVDDPLAECQTCSLQFPPDISYVKSIMPISQNYPLNFLSEFRTVMYDGNYEKKPNVKYAEWLMVIEKDNQTSPWQIGFVTSYDYDGSQGDYPFFQTDTYNSSSPNFIKDQTNLNSTLQNIEFSPKTALLVKLANYWQHFKLDGEPPKDSKFISSGDNYYYGKYLAAYNRNGEVLTDPASGLQYKQTLKYLDMFTTYGTENYVYRLNKNEYMGCGAVIVQIYFTPVDYPFLVQTSAKDYGSDVPPGRYKQIVGRLTHSSCVLLNSTTMESFGNINGGVASMYTPYNQ